MCRDGSDSRIPCTAVVSARTLLENNFSFQCGWRLNRDISRLASQFGMVRSEVVGSVYGITIYLGMAETKD